MKKLGKKKKNKLIAYCETIGGELYVSAPISSYIIQTCRRWGGTWDADKKKWRVPPERLKNLIKLLGDQSLPLVRVKVTEDQITGFNSRNYCIGLYSLAYTGGKKIPIQLHADVIEGEAWSGGSNNYPKVISDTVVFAIWVPTDFAARKQLEIIGDPSTVLQESKELLEAQLAEIESLINKQENIEATT